MIRRSPNGETRAGITCQPYGEYIAVGQPSQGTETSKYLDERKAKSDSPSSGERTGNSLNPSSASVPALLDGCCGILRKGRHPLHRVTKGELAERYHEWPATGGESPVCESKASRARHPSTAGHVKSGGNLGGPSSKAKYS